MSVLVLRLAGPMAAWGLSSRFDIRDSAPWPTRSALLGMVAASLGRRRGDRSEDLAGLSFVVRVDTPGLRVVDYHTIGAGHRPEFQIVTTTGKPRSGGRSSKVTQRIYIADATYVVAVSSDDEELVAAVEQALREPYWAPHLGRRSCPVTEPLILGTARDDLDPVALLAELPVLRSVRPVPDGPAGDGDLFATAAALAAPSEVVQLVGDQPVGAECSQHLVPDDPLPGAVGDSRHRTRLEFRQILTVPISQCVGADLRGVAALQEHLRRTHR